MTKSPTRPTRSRGHWFAIIGALMQIAPVLGMIATVAWMVRSFAALNTSPSGTSDPSQLGALIGEALIATFVGMLISLVGAILLLLAVFPMRYRSPWLYWLLILLGSLYLLAAPLGTIIGIVFLLVASTKRQEFFPPLSSDPPTAKR